MTQLKTKITHATDKQCMWFITLSTMLLTLLWFGIIGIKLLHTLGDTGTYLFAGRSLFSGTLDELRTPVYPALCQIFTLGKYFNGLYLGISDTGVLCISALFFQSCCTTHST